MATYREIQTYVRDHFGYTPKTCWIAHVKELCALPVRRAANRRGEVRLVPCPAHKQEDIVSALEHFGMLERLPDRDATLVREAERQVLSARSCTPTELASLLSVLSPPRRVLHDRLSGVFCLREPPVAYSGWSIAPTMEFCKTVQRMDKKVKGRVLEAITELSDKPTKLRGDTVKPLSGEFKGRWRYRIGDYRLIYWPDDERRTVFLLAVLSRGTAY